MTVVITCAPSQLLIFCANKIWLIQNPCMRIQAVTEDKQSKIH